MRELTNHLAESQRAYDELKIKYKASLAKRRELAKQMTEITENSSSDEAEMDALVQEVEKLNESKTYLRRELEGLTIRMSQELENIRKAKDLVKDKEHEIFKLNQEIGTITAYLQEGKEEKEEMQVELNATISQNETLMKTNDALSKELVETKETLAKFNRSVAKLDQKLESMKPSKDTSGLGFSAYEVGESSGIKTDAPKEQSKPKINQNKGKPNFKPVCFNCHKEGHTANVCRVRLTIIFLTCKTMCTTTMLEPIDLMVIVMHATSLGIDILSANQL